MIDHISLSVSSFDKSVEFYDGTLSILGYKREMTFDVGNDQGAGYGKDGKPSFWIGAEAEKRVSNEEIGRAQGFHVAFIASSAEDIQKWHAKCLELGGRDNGAPGVRKEYHPHYYGAFIIDLDGWRIEAVMHNYSGE